MRSLLLLTFVVTASACEAPPEAEDTTQAVTTVPHKPVDTGPAENISPRAAAIRAKYIAQGKQPKLAVVRKVTDVEAAFFKAMVARSEAQSGGAR